MIRYPIAKDPDPTPERDLEVLCQLIEAEVPGWLTRAKRRTSKLQKLKRYDEKTAIWSEVKTVFAQLQHDKCAYCERKLRGASDDGKVEQDVEHFRPKGEVTTWSPKDTSGQSDRQETGVGYFLLAYAPQNYLISCKTCNSTLKANYFPIKGERRALPSTNPSDYGDEQPYLIYPLGCLDENPEDHLEFSGFTPYPKNLLGLPSGRGKVIIDFFNLFDSSTLLFERASLIRALGFELKENGAIDAYLSDGFPHGNCMRSFIRLWREDQAAATQIHEFCGVYMSSKSPPEPIHSVDRRP